MERQDIHSVKFGEAVLDTEFYDKGAIDAIVGEPGKSQVYRYRGSVPYYDDLPTPDEVAPGDVYNVELDDMNYAWAEGSDDNGYWDPLGPSLEGYATKGYVDDGLAGKLGKSGGTMTGTLTAPNFYATRGENAFVIAPDGPTGGVYTTFEHPGVITVTEQDGANPIFVFVPGTVAAAANPAKTLALRSDVGSATTLTAETRPARSWTCYPATYTARTSDPDYHGNPDYNGLPIVINKLGETTSNDTELYIPQVLDPQTSTFQDVGIPIPVVGGVADHEILSWHPDSWTGVGGLVAEFHEDQEVMSYTLGSQTGKKLQPAGTYLDYASMMADVLRILPSAQTQFNSLDSAASSPAEKLVLALFKAIGFKNTSSENS